MLVRRLAIEDNSISVDEVLLHLVREYSFKRVTFVGSADLLDGFGDFRVVLAGFQETESCLD
jgi:hypothetical protein